MQGVVLDPDVLVGSGVCLPQTIESRSDLDSAVRSGFQLRSSRLKLVPVRDLCLHLLRACHAKVFLGKGCVIGIAAGCGLPGSRLQHALAVRADLHGVVIGVSVIRRRDAKLGQRQGIAVIVNIVLDPGAFCEVEVGITTAVEKGHIFFGCFRTVAAAVDVPDLHIRVSRRVDIQHIGKVCIRPANDREHLVLVRQRDAGGRFGRCFDRRLSGCDIAAAV